VAYAERTGLTAYMAILEGSETLILACKEATLPVRFVWKAGDRLPAHTTSVGKAMLVEMGREQPDVTLGTGKLPNLDGTLP
jgi:DNA-binding IclR family transcriptional regulator